MSNNLGKTYIWSTSFYFKGEGVKNSIFAMALGLTLVGILILTQSINPVSVGSSKSDGKHVAENTIKLILETDKDVYILGENISITLKNVGEEKVSVGGYPPWQIFTYPDEEPVYPKIFAFLAWFLEPGQNDTYVWNQYNEFTGTFCKPGKYVIKDTQGWNLSAYFEIVPMGVKIINTGVLGMAPKVYGDIITFFTDEKLADEDLNGDGERDDLIIRYYNITSQSLINTEVVGHYPAIYKNIITFTGLTVKYFNLTSRSFVDTGALAFVDIPSIYGSIIAFPTYEINAGMDLNGDGDRDDSVIRYYDILTGALTNTKNVGWGASIYGEIIAFSTFEWQAGQDLNGDGDVDDSVIRYLNITSGTTVNTRAEGWWPTIYGDIIAFEALYSTYIAITYHNISDGSLVDTKIDGRMACVYENLIVFSTPEADFGVGDLNGDGDWEDWVVRYYDISTKTLVNLGVEGISPSIYKNVIAFETYEKDAGKDLNNDGDMDDNIIRYALLNTPQVEASVKISPKALNLLSKGKWVTASIELPEGYEIANVNASTILLNGSIPIDVNAPITIGDYDNDSIPDLTVKFERAKIIQYILANINIKELLKRFMTITLTITGKLNDGTTFQGSDTVKIIIPMPRYTRFIHFY